MQIQGETPHQQLEDFRRAMDAIGETHVRGIAFALNGIAMQSHKELMRVLNRVIDKPGAFTKKGLIYRTTPLDTKLEKDLESAVLWLDQQSAYIKYLMGQGDNVRLPGDIGPDHGLEVFLRLPPAALGKLEVAGPGGLGRQASDFLYVHALQNVRHAEAEVLVVLQHEGHGGLHQGHTGDLADVAGQTGRQGAAAEEAPAAPLADDDAVR